MKKLALALAFVAALCFSALTATAKGHSESHGKPSQTGVKHAETKQSKGSLKTISKTKGKHQKYQGTAR